MVKYIYTISLFLSIALNIQAQQGNNITFGTNGGLNFSTEPPSLFTSNSEYAGMTTTMSDCEGNLLFYATGNKVWNRSHQVMENGVIKSTSTGTNGSRYPVLSLPYPDSLNHYIIIYSDPGVINYAVLDMSQNGGLGKVTSKGNVISTIEHRRRTEIIQHSNGKDYWLILKETDFEFSAYPITKNGIGLPIISQGFGWAEWSTIKASNKGNKIAVSVYSNLPNAVTKYPFPVYVYDFDKATGKFSNPLPVLDWSEIIGSEIQGIQFSPNDSLLYLTNRSGWQVSSSKQKLLFQINLYSLNPVFFHTKLINQNYLGNSNVRGLFIGSNNKIYMFEGFDSTKIAVIHKPNVYGNGCQLVRGEIDVSPASHGFQVGSIYQPIYNLAFNSNAQDSVCTDTASFAITGDTTPFKQYILYYGDGDSSILNNTQRNSTHKYASEGKFYVKLKALTKDCNYPIWRSDSVSVRFKPKAKFTIDSTLNSCGKREVFISDSSLRVDSFAFSWLSTKPIITNKQGARFSLLIDSNAIYNLQHTVKNDWGCVDTFKSNLAITIPDFPTKGFTIKEKDSAGCVDHTITLYDSAKKSTQTIFYWGDGDSLITTSPGNVVAQYQRTYTSAGIFKPYQTVSNTDGCKDTFYFADAITVIEKAKAGFSVTIDSTCTDIQITLNDTSTFADSIQYTSPFTFTGKAKELAQDIFNTNGNYTFTQKVWNSYCRDSVSITLPLFKKQLPDIDFKADKVSGCEPLIVSLSDDSTQVPLKNVFVDFGDGQQFTNTSALNGLSHTFSNSGTYTAYLTDTAQNGCFKSDSIEITVFPQPTSNIIAKPVSNCGEVSLTVIPNAQNANNYSVVWGDGFSFQNQPIADSVVHKYPIRLGINDTSYSVRLIISNTNGCKDTAFVPVVHPAHNILPIPEVLGVSVTNPNEVTLEWKEVLGTKEYQVENSLNGVSFSPILQNPQATSIQQSIESNLPTDKRSIYYRVIAKDSCALNSPVSVTHKTILLTEIVNDVDKAILQWSPYELWQNGVLEYSLEYRDKNVSNTNPAFKTLNTYTNTNTPVEDIDFEKSTGDERCYRIVAKEQGGNNYTSFSNEVCLQQKPTIIVPNAFSPNGDGLNDVFTPTATSMKKMTITIYNQYGEVVFSETAKQPKWDGTYKGTTAQIGQYMVLIQAVGSNKRKINYNGYIYLLR